MASDLLSKIHLWGWQAIILGAAITLPLGITQSKEYAELEWFLDILVVLVWVAFAINYFWTLAIRNEKNLYVAIWFYISTIVTIALLYIVNNLALPISGTKSYGIFAGAQDALTQWWYGHNAVAFFLTTPILGIMYYFVPKAAGRPVYSYRLSIVHFWSLIFLYIWAGPHHLLYSSLPDWAQSVGMLFSLMLWAPSWGGMLNGLLTLRGAWHKVRTDPVLKFFVAAVTFYGMATFEGPLLSIKSVNALGHFTDWIVGHVHSGALGWNGFMAAGMFYYLVPRLFGTKLWSTRMADLHFWIGTFGIVLYVIAMWISGITHGLMWRAETGEGTLQYSNWADMTEKVFWLYVIRSVGGGLFLLGWVLMSYNLFRTWRAGRAVDGSVEVARLVPPPAGQPSTAGLVFGVPFVVSSLGMLAALLMGGYSLGLAVVGLVLAIAVVIAAAFCLAHASAGGRFAWHDLIETRPLAFSILIVFAVAVGGIVELVPGIVVQQEVPLTVDGRMAVQPYTPLELEGRDLYVREGCYVCHSQMVRPFRSEYLRYGAPSRIEESMWDRPFQWGSRRIGPDLARVGTKGWDALWHYQHMRDPRSTSPGSNMPAYPWLGTGAVEVDAVAGKLRAMKALGVPYTDAQILDARANYLAQAGELVKYLADRGITIAPDREFVALAAYLLRLGKNEIPAAAASK